MRASMRYCVPSYAEGRAALERLLNARLDVSRERRIPFVYDFLTDDGGEERFGCLRHP
jgi:hypothetical protein